MTHIPQSHIGGAKKRIVVENVSPALRADAHLAARILRYPNLSALLLAKIDEAIAAARAQAPGAFPQREQTDTPARRRKRTTPR